MNNRKTKHTEGPWSLEITDDSIFVCPSVNDHDYVALIDKRWDTSVTGAHEANARLIAAAPEMLEALEWILGHVGRCTAKEHLTDEYGLGKIKTPYGVGTVVDAHLIIEKIKSAIIKAGGES